MIINIITLGCSKNLVDSEYLLRQIQASGHTVYHDRDDIEADAVILNTCGFILDAKEESIREILRYTSMKQEGRIHKLIIMGCLSERYREDLLKEIPEADGIFGVWDHPGIIRSLGAVFDERLTSERIITTPSHYAFLKISEGCNRQCSFCAIPGIRGGQRSRPVTDLLAEARNILKNGARELILIAQDLTNYGVDLDGRKQLPQLLEALAGLDGLEWIRLHYAYPTGFPDEVIDIMAENPRVCRYLDIPIQHINDRILLSMNRGHNRQKLEQLLYRLRDKVPGVAVRTTVMTGYPGETEEEFEELVEFIRTFRFDRLGVFPYSHEEDTPAAALKDDIPAEVKRARADMIMELQQDISLEINQSRVGEIYRVLIDREEDEYLVGRTEYDSPEVDNEVLIKKPVDAGPGTFIQVKITGADAFDLYGSLC